MKLLKLFPTKRKARLKFNNRSSTFWITYEELANRKINKNKTFTKSKIFYTKKRYPRVVDIYVSSLSWTIFPHNRKVEVAEGKITSQSGIEKYIFLSAISSSSYFLGKADRSGQSTHVTGFNVAYRPRLISQNNIIKPKDLPSFGWRSQIVSMTTIYHKQNWPSSLYSFSCNVTFIDFVRRDKYLNSSPGFSSLPPHDTRAARSYKSSYYTNKIHAVLRACSLKLNTNFSRG